MKIPGMESQATEMDNIPELLRKETFSSEILYLVILAAVLIILYFILPSKMMATEILIMSMPSLAFILLFGYAGLLNFGTGSLFAVGAYTAGILLARLNVDIFLAILAAVVMTGIVSIIIGYFCIKKAGLIFSLLTLAFNQLIWFIIWTWRSLTGGHDGIWGIHRSTLNLGLMAIDIKPNFNFYIFVLIFFLLLFFLSRRLIESPFGKVMMCIRENELRAIAIGYNPNVYKWITFVISGLICGLGGALFALHQEYVGEHLANWGTSGDILIMALLGGAFHIPGALIGSSVFIFLTDFLNRFEALSVSGASLFILGIILILVVMFFKGGIYGGAEKVYTSLKKRNLRE